ncbi:zinc-ribbon domain-containing protein [Cuniculiplasma sp. SKW4]|uniref:zinc-ribbon domain-containing protein n=1 Tax=Cuniculiplasma sp. SKW4 TaxID=3400171 RepID=UPI003FD1E57D
MLGTKKGRILRELLSGPKMMTDLKSVISSYDVLRYNLLELQTEGYISKKESRDDKRRFLISLTEKGRKVAEQLLKAEEVAQGNEIENFTKIEVSEETANRMNELRLLFHVNVMDDHVTIEEVPRNGGRPRIFNVYIRRNGHDDFRLWCEHDDSFDCVHVEVAWTYPQVQHMVLSYKGKVKVCPVCGAENRERAKFCDQCGVKLD